MDSVVFRKEGSNRSGESSLMNYHLFSNQEEAWGVVVDIASKVRERFGDILEECSLDYKSPGYRIKKSCQSEELKLGVYTFIQELIQEGSYGLFSVVPSRLERKENGKLKLVRDSHNTKFTTNKNGTVLKRIGYNIAGGLFIYKEKYQFGSKNDGCRMSRFLLEVNESAEGVDLKLGKNGLAFGGERVHGVIYEESHLVS